MCMRCRSARLAVQIKGSKKREGDEIRYIYIYIYKA